MSLDDASTKPHERMQAALAEDLNGTIVSRTKHVLPEDDTQSNPGWGFYLKDGKLQVNLVNRWLDDCLRLETKQPVTIGKWQQVGFTYDGTRLASGVRIFIDGEPVDLKVILAHFAGQFRIPLEDGTEGLPKDGLG